MFRLITHHAGIHLWIHHFNGGHALKQPEAESQISTPELDAKCSLIFQALDQLLKLQAEKCWVINK